MTVNKLTRALFILSIGVFLFGSGFKIGQYQSIRSLTQTISQKDALDFSLFWDTWRQLEEKYVDKKKLDPTKMFYGAIKGMVASVDDPYTFFLTPDENKQSKDDLGGKFEGIGAQLGLKGVAIVVIAPLKNSPAERAGVRAGDIIVKVDDKSTQDWTLFQAVSAIRGKSGTTVKLTLFRKDKDIDVSIKREAIKVESVELTFEKNAAVLKLTRFGDNTNAEWAKAVSEIEKRYRAASIKGMVLDMRDNPGGYLQSAVYISSEFLPEGKLVVKQQYYDGKSEDFTVDRTGQLLSIPVAVLVNKGSASASEIVAGTLQDYKRAKLVGEKSFGKGSIQEALDLSKGAGLHVTVAKWILPKGEWINGKGVKPDIEIENKISEGNTLTRENDAQLDRALEVLGK